MRMNPYSFPVPGESALDRAVAFDDYVAERARFAEHETEGEDDERGESEEVSEGVREA